MIDTAVAMCKNGKHAMTDDNVKVKSQRDTRSGKVHTYAACRACSSARHHRYDTSWKGQERNERKSDARYTDRRK